jgi:hypothetical protein
MRTHLNSAGVFLTTVGALLIWCFLGELNFASKSDYLKGHGRVEIPDPTPRDISRFKMSIRLSRVGMALIVTGGVLQIIGNYSETCP